MLTISMIIMLVLNITASMLITYPIFYIIHSQKLQLQITQICHPIIIYTQIKEIIKYEGWLCADFENCRLLFVVHELTILICWRFQYNLYKLSANHRACLILPWLQYVVYIIMKKVIVNLIHFVSNKFKTWKNSCFMSFYVGKNDWIRKWNSQRIFCMWNQCNRKSQKAVPSNQNNHPGILTIPHMHTGSYNLLKFW